MSKCVNCGGKGTHEHHVVPKVKGGTFTVLLCLECHGKVHDREMASPYLTKLGIYKNSDHYLHFSYFFGHIIIDQKQLKEACESYYTDFGQQLQPYKAKRYLKKMADLNPDDLLDLLDPLWDFNNNAWYTRERVKQLWIESSPYPVNLEAQHA